MERRFIVTNHEYINTGGNTMISVFAVYDSTENVSRFVIANEERFWWQTADTISSELQIDCDELYNKIVIGEWPWEALTCEPSFDQHQFTAEEFELFKYCQFEYIKKDAKHFSIKYRLSINELPQELYNKLTPHYREWADREGVGALTDGYDVFMDDNYEPPVKEVDRKAIADELERKLQEMKNFRQWYVDLITKDTSEERMQELYESHITIAVAGNSIKLDFDADIYNNVLTVIDRAIEEF